MSISVRITANDEGIRAERWVEKQYPQIPRSMRHKFFRTKKIAFFRDNKRLPLQQSLLLNAQDEVRLFFNPEEFGEKKDQKKKQNFNSILRHPSLSRVNIVWEDEFLMIIEKPSGIAVHPGSGIAFGHSAIDYCKALLQTKNPSAPEPKLIHRLDKDTSGLIMVSKNDAVLRKMSRIMSTEKIEKIYYAVVSGRLNKTEGSITDKIQRTEGSKYNKISINNESGKHSLTHYVVKKYSPNTNTSLVKIRLGTGRMHQIRIHFSSIGHPLAGDTIYGNTRWNKTLFKKYGIKGQALHAWGLKFFHPETEKEIVVESTIPTLFFDILNGVK